MASFESQKECKICKFNFSLAYLLFSRSLFRVKHLDDMLYVFRCMLCNDNLDSRGEHKLKASN